MPVLTESASGISTHSLTRRLTEQLLNSLFYLDISTHSLTRRLTFAPATRNIANSYFNSQPHKEADKKMQHRFLF